MYKLLLIFISFFTLNAYELAENYFFENTTVYSTDLFEDSPKKFELLKIPEDKTLYRVDSNVIVKSFELNGMTITSENVRFVNFTKKSPIDFTPLKTQLETLLRHHYPSITLKEITITPRGYLPPMTKTLKGIFEDRLYLHSVGTFYVIDDSGLRRYLDYSVRATINILHTSQKILRRERLSGFNTLLKPTPFTRFKDKPLSAIPDQPSRFRSNLRASQLLTSRNIETMPLVLKNEKVIVEIKSDGVIVEFGATATQEGSLYDIITIQKSDGKRVKSKVIGENRVELQ
ncbi:flagellar basal body P-ring formation chaperone FlgA [Sulfuricurvum sp.]|uniref:flagellar basal body P-ring formation chaperone FlgA n=1 Tax=Sulfuricurvum sp. TaxID=2025608 RepID=UPI00261C2150|nr:flagellar basal body P-ring formation chaperone FlgA [Sulfuricurvum sp.]MDD2781118.1 flagellar basal body P-ring formation chaperone FlgA [Sulfuricurvum sp.]